MIEVGDISSSNRNSRGARRGDVEWRDRYYDTVGFSTAPTSITSNTTPGTGAGTFGDLSRRSGPDEITGTGGIRDTFSFATTISGPFTMVYTQPPVGSTGGVTGNNRGWQFIGITRISFGVPC